MAKYWSNDADKTHVFSKYIIDNKHYGMWALQIQDNRHAFHVVTHNGVVLGSKHCTQDGPVYSLFDSESVELVHVAPHLVSDDCNDLGAWEKGSPGPANGRFVGLKEFRLFILGYLKRNIEDVYCCSTKRAEIHKW